MWDTIAKHISERTGAVFRLANARPVGGGCINQAYQLDGDGGPFFAKLNRAESLEMFEAEADGLRDIADTGTIRVPNPVCHGTSGGQAYLVLEHVKLGNIGSQAELGQRLAKLHSVPQMSFGWRRDNTIGSTPQPNPKSNDWVAFLREHRLGFQCHLAKRNGLRLDGADQLLEQLDSFFTYYKPKPSLLHGDLWSGNMAFGPSGEPVIFDPATYRGDREAEFGLAEMFGGFGDDFWSAYKAERPLDDGYPTRKLLYRLYHTLNHFNLFGGGYGSEAEGIVGRLLRRP
jgi:fructosamine-3-kinase